MRLVSFLREGNSRIGGVVDGQIVDLSIAVPSLPTNLVSLLELGPEAMKQAEDVLPNRPRKPNQPWTS